MINQIVSKWSPRAQLNWSSVGSRFLLFSCWRSSAQFSLRGSIQFDPVSSDTKPPQYYFPACSRYRSFLILGSSNLLCKKASLKNLVDIQIQEYVNRDERGGFSTSWLVFWGNPANSLIKNLFQAIHRLFLAVAVSSPDLQCLCRCC
jgi:hypothetical protein